MEEKITKVEMISMPNITLYKLDLYMYNHNYFVNGEKLQETFKSGWYKTKGKINRIEEKKTRIINEKWELKNKQLYNETLPIIVDEHSKEKYKEIVKSDLYKYTYEEEEYLENIEFEIIKNTKIKDEILFETKSGISRYNSWRNNRKETLLIEECTYSFAHQCLIESPLLELTCPLILNYECLWNILSNRLKNVLDYDKVKAEFDSLRFKIYNRKSDKKIEMDIYCKTLETEQGLFANNINELQLKIEFLVNDIKKFIEDDNMKISYFEYNCDFDDRFLEQEQENLKNYLRRIQQ